MVGAGLRAALPTKESPLPSAGESHGRANWRGPRVTDLLAQLPQFEGVRIVISGG